jgi:hypothetical protein
LELPSAGLRAVVKAARGCRAFKLQQPGLHDAAVLCGYCAGAS